MDVQAVVDPSRNRFPYCVVWTPLPFITWVLPFIGHMGICDSAGVISDFSGSYTVSKDDKAFGKPTKYWQLTPSKAEAASWDSAVHQASEEYTHRTHNLFCDNSHSYVAQACNLMKYDGSSSWNMVKLGFYMVIHSKYTNCGGFLKTWLPFMIIVSLITIIAVVLPVTLTQAT